MSKDVNVEQTYLLHDYSEMLHNFTSSISQGCKNLMYSIEDEENDLDRSLRKLERMEENLTSRANEIIRRYDFTRDRYRLDGVNSAMLGTTDQELKQCLTQLKSSISFQKDMIKRCILRLQSIKERTKSFSTNVSGISERGKDSLNKYADVIDDYKQTRQ